jgi:putative membrane protein insertion efficiency factor
MMKKLIIKLIKIYQKIPFRSHYYCRFYPTCSNYFMEAVERYGAFKGSILGIKRLLRCHPFGKSGIDLVPIEGVKR